MNKKYEISIVADILQSSMGERFKSLTEAGLQELHRRCERSFVNGAMNLDVLRRITTLPAEQNGKFKGVVSVGNRGIASPEAVKSRIDAALEEFSTAIGLHLEFKAWQPPQQLVDQFLERYKSDISADDEEPDFKCFRLEFKDGKWVVVYNALAGCIEGRDCNFPTPLGSAPFQGEQGDVYFDSVWLITLSYEL